MSLINEALKRANQSRPPRTLDETHLPPMRPVATAAHPVIWPLALVTLALLFLFTLAIWFLWHGWQAIRHDQVQVEPAPVSAREPNHHPTPASAQPAQRPTISVPAPRTAPPAAILITNPASPADVPPAGAAPPAPEFKLQAIFYRPNRASVMVNSKMLGVGESVDGARVLAITRSSVTLLHAGATNVLTLR
jgi:hypothetical protein